MRSFIGNKQFPGGNLGREQWEASKVGTHYCPNENCPGLKAIESGIGPGAIDNLKGTNGRVFFDPERDCLTTIQSLNCQYTITTSNHFIGKNIPGLHLNKKLGTTKSKSKVIGIDFIDNGSVRLWLKLPTEENSCIESPESYVKIFTEANEEKSHSVGPIKSAGFNEGACPILPSHINAKGNLLSAGKTLIQAEKISILIEFAQKNRNDWRSFTKEEIDAFAKKPISIDNLGNGANNRPLVKKKGSRFYYEMNLIILCFYYSRATTRTCSAIFIRLKKEIQGTSLNPEEEPRTIAPGYYELREVKTPTGRYFNLLDTKGAFLAIAPKEWAEKVFEGKSLDATLDQY